ncbi:hypothetical protein [Pandoraea oxalativorans]|uniref:hypothetical protein n=1 Tax=Pandoraea oxalativorans TaxID=573737 RepID=UPI001FDFE2E4|nr:hypothetical protein [Pandoraea oxalativorans]
MESISNSPVVNKPLSPAEIPPDARLDTAPTIPSDLRFAAPASLEVVWEGETGWKGRGRLPELVARYWLYAKGSPEYARFKADFREAVKVRLDIDNSANARDGLESLLRSCPQQFRGFPANEYLELFTCHCPDGEKDEINGLMAFSGITGSDSKSEMRRVIGRILVSALGAQDERNTRAVPASDLKHSLSQCLEHVGKIDSDSSRQFVLDLLGDIRDVDEKHRLNALRKYCEIIPERIKQIPQSELQELPAILALNDADTSGALKCLGVTTGHVFLPQGIFADWKEVASLRPDVPGDQKKRTDFANQLRQKIDKIVDDGRDANFVMREVVLRLGRLDEDTQAAGAKLLREFFKKDLSRMAAALGGNNLVHRAIAWRDLTSFRTLDGRNLPSGVRGDAGSQAAGVAGRLAGLCRRTRGVARGHRAHAVDLFEANRQGDAVRAVRRTMSPGP